MNWKILNMGIGTILTVLLIGMLLVACSDGGSLYPNPPDPKIKYGEFPFRLTYELNGDTKIIEDTVICEFYGFETWGEAGKYRKWKTHLKSGNERITLLDLRPSDEINEFGQKMLELYFSFGTAEYYMDDELGSKKRAGEISNWVDYMYQSTDGTIGYSGYKVNVAREKYKIKLISWEPSPPITNSFK